MARSHGGVVCARVSRPGLLGHPPWSFSGQLDWTGGVGGAASAAQIFVREKGSEACPWEAGDRGEPLPRSPIHPSMASFPFFSQLSEPPMSAAEGVSSALGSS